MMIVILFLMIAMLMLMIVTCLRSSFPLTKSLSLLWASLNIRISQKPPISKIIRISKIITVSNKTISISLSPTSIPPSPWPVLLRAPGNFCLLFVCYLFCLFSFLCILYVHIYVVCFPLFHVFLSLFGTFHCFVCPAYF